MRKSKIAWKFLLAVAVCSAAPLAGCGSKPAASSSANGANSPAPPAGKLAEPPLDQQIELKLDPLTEQDVELYLKVMRAAAERVKNPAPGDKTALEDAKKILTGRVSGRIPTPEDVKTLERANQVALSMDQIVAEKMKLDARTYRGIAEAVESVVPNPALGPASGQAATPARKHPLTPLEMRLREVNAANTKFLAPYRQEIQDLIAIVHNPANLPTSARHPD